MSDRLNVKGLIALNVVLLVILGLVSWAPRATAGGATTAVGEYAMVGGEVNGLTSNAIYIMDQRTGALVAMAFDRSSKRLRGMGIRNVKTDERRAGPGR